MIIDIPIGEFGGGTNVVDVLGLAAREIDVLMQTDGSRTVNSRSHGRVFRVEGVRLLPMPSESYRAHCAPDDETKKLGRRKNAVCFHGHREWMRGLFRRFPRAVIKSSMATWDGEQDFEARFAGAEDPRRNESCRCVEADVMGFTERYSTVHLASLGIQV